MPTLRVELFEGRSDDQKRTLAKALTDACVRSLGCSPGSVDILLYELPPKHWATGGVLWSEAPAPSPPVATGGDTPKMPLAD